MPSLTDIQQQTAKISLSKNGKSTPPPMTTTNEATNVDPLGQVVQALEKKQRNLMKRKDKLESYEQAAKSGKELNTDQKEALAKYSEVLGQIECVKDLSEQVKKIQTDAAKNQKRLSKQAAEEKRVLLSHRLREYTQLRYLLDHRPSSLKAEESALLDELSGVVIPTDASLSTITRAVDTILAIYQSGPSSTVKTLTGRSSQEVRDTLEQLIKQFETTSVPSSSTSSLTEETATPQQPSLIETVNQTPLVPQPPPSTPASVLPPRESNKQHSSNTNDVLGSALTHTHLIPTQLNEHPLQFDTRDQNIPYHQLMQDSLFFLPLEPTPGNHNQQEPSNNQDNNTLQSTETNQYLQPANTLNSNLPGQSSSSPQDYSQSSTDATQRAGVATYEQNVSSNAGHMSADDQQSEEQWQHRRGNGGSAYRGGQYNGNANKNYSRGGASNYNQQQQQWRGPRGGHYENSYGGGQRHYNDSNPRAGGGGQRGGSNPNYRGNRGGGGNYRGGNRGGNAGHNGNGYARSSQQPQQ